MVVAFDVSDGVLEEATEVVAGVVEEEFELPFKLLMTDADWF